jgi:hypothetical protein
MFTNLKTMKISGALACGCTAILLIAACASDSIIPTASSDVALVTLRPAVVRGAMNGFELMPDTMTVVAELRDGRGTLINDRAVTWNAQLPDGTPVGDTIVSISSSGDHAALLRFHRESLFVLIGTVPTSSGKSVSGSLNISWASY